jgi:feruloyl esterase
MLKRLLFVSSAAALLAAALPASAATCESLASLALPNTTITLAQTVAAGAFVPPTPARGGRGGPNYKDLPAFCRVLASVKPVADSDIKIEVWIPTDNWNGKFEGTANGAWAGSIGQAALAGALSRGYASATTDTGHEGNSASFALEHPEKLIDFQYRAIHEMTAKGKALTMALYGDNALKYSYFVGCSTGGREALKEAQRFPNDYDAIVAGDPASYTTHMAIMQVGVGVAVHKDAATYIPAEKFPAIHRAALDQCDALDGVKDGVIDNPRKCRFDPKVIQCKGEDSPSCLTAPQVEAVRKIYAPAINPRTGKEIFPGLEPGSEMGWSALIGKDAFSYAMEWLLYGVFKDPKWNYMTLNFDSDVTASEKAGGDAMDANDPDLRPFLSHGGKLLMYHGWADPAIAPGVSVNYYQAALAKMDSVKNLQDSLRLFMVPGMLHCGGGDGPNTFDTLAALEQWREKGKAPDQLIASHMTNGVADRTRPLCPYPQVAVYKGSGSTDQAENFTCALQR